MELDDEIMREVDAFYLFHFGSKKNLEEFCQEHGLPQDSTEDQFGDPLARANLYTLGMYGVGALVAAFSGPALAIPIGLYIAASWTHSYLPRLFTKKDMTRKPSISGLVNGLLKLD